VTTFLQQKMMTMPSTDAQAKSMNQTMSLFMPLFMGYITLSFASGLAIYWVAFNIVGIIQQYFVTGWGELARYIPQPLLRILPGPASAPVMAHAAVEPAKKADPKARRRARVDAQAGDERTARRMPAGTAAGEVKLPRRRPTDDAAIDTATTPVRQPARPEAAAPSSGRKVKRKAPPN